MTNLWSHNFKIELYPHSFQPQIYVFIALLLQQDKWILQSPKHKNKYAKKKNVSTKL